MAEIEPLPEPPIEIKEVPTIIKEATKENKKKKSSVEKILELLTDYFPYIVVVIFSVIVYYFIKQNQEPEQILSTESFDSS